MGDGADGLAVRRGGDAPRRRRSQPLRRRRHHLAPERPLGVHHRATVRRPAHPRCREELRARDFPAVQQERAESISGEKDRQRPLGGDVRQDLLARPRDRLLPRRALSLHDEQSAREQLLGLRFERSRPAQLEEDRAHRGPAVGGQISEPVPHGVLHGRLQALSVDPAPLPGGQRRDGRRHQDLEDQEGDPGHRAGHANAGG